MYFQPQQHNNIYIMKKAKNIIAILTLSLIALPVFADAPAKKTAVIASDPSGLVIKNAVKEFLITQGIEVTDLTGEEKQNYYDVGFNLGKAMTDKNYDFGFVFCGSGMGVNLVVNKFSEIYCAVCESVETAKMARIINNANVLAMGGKVVDAPKAVEMAKAFISTSFAKDNDFLRNSYNRVLELTKEITKLNAKK